MRQTLVAGNWKMNGSQAMVTSVVGELARMDLKSDVMICPPFPYVAAVKAALSGTAIQVGGQDCSGAVSGAFTGEVAAGMLQELGCDAVILGHSERRVLHGETDEQILAKVERALEQNLQVLLCVGETLEQRNAGDAESVVARQLALVLEQLSVEQLLNLVVAYEPVWAIGTGETATPEQAQGMHAFIRSLLNQRSEDLAEKMRILYGGSVKADNAAELFSQPDIDGALVGGASLDAGQFSSICNA